MTADEIHAALAKPLFWSEKVVPNPLPGPDRLAIQVYSADFDTQKLSNGIAQSLAFIKDRPAAVESAIWRALQENFEENDGEYESRQAQFDFETKSNDRLRGAKVPTAPSQVWDLIDIQSIAVSDYRGGFQISYLGACAWDAEHGFGLHFDEGGALREAGEYNVY